ncbi:MAG: dihydrolipoamide acetyltransferase family protein [Fimbriimonadaceae bacterium]|nr:MAG: Pyruvate/2-oxoglutarate dehydrogenase complex,dihydrolipoamide acyltransferase (E2) component [Armatimonadetes bacterium OLB18]WKZ80895.1 MAG: dihydrolipoamide acetyltransferase family protein [Fimbriimonadaceae bacterium]
MTEVIMPKMGDAMEEGVLVEWLAEDGQKVKSGQVIGTIQTDKATLELESPASGVFGGVLVKAGATVPVGIPIAAILAEGEKLPKNWGKDALTSKEAPSPKEEAAPVQAHSSLAEAPAANASTQRVKASPLAKKIAEELGVPIALVHGTGPGGRIVEQDVRAAASVATPAGTRLLATPSKEDRVVSLNRIRKITADRTAQSKQQVPHFYVGVDVDVENLLDLKDQLDEEGVGKVSVNDFVIRASALALRKMPGVNASFQGDSILEYGAVNIGLAVALEDGLTLPVLHNADSLPIRQIAERSRELALKARENRLTPDELSGSTFSISNMGMLNVDDFSAIINQPNAAILAVSTASRKVVPSDTEEDAVEIRTLMRITGSFDHRVVDGAIGARFMNVLRDYLQNPIRLIV